MRRILQPIFTFKAAIKFNQSAENFSVSFFLLEKLTIVTVLAVVFDVIDRFVRRGKKVVVVAAVLRSNGNSNARRDEMRLAFNG